MPIRTVNVVLSARIIDPFNQDELGEFKTVDSVEIQTSEPITQAIEYAMEIADRAADWKVVER